MHPHDPWRKGLRSCKTEGITMKQPAEHEDPS